MISVAVDIDGTICNTYTAWSDIAELEGITDYHMSEYNSMFKTYTPEGKNFGELLFTKYRMKWLKEAKPYLYAVEVCRFLAEHPDVKMYYVTARKPDVRSETKDWLNKHGFPYAPLIHTEDKLDVDCQILIDDKLEHVESYVNASRMGILIDHSYNQQRLVRYRVEHLREALDIIKEYL